MPTYEFRAPDGSIIERVFKISEVPEFLELPDGGGRATRMISGGAGLLFKGSGFYITDYGKDGKKDQRPAESKSEGKSESRAESSSADSAGSSKSETKSESKPAAAATPTKAGPSSPKAE